MGKFKKIKFWKITVLLFVKFDYERNLFKIFIIYFYQESKHFFGQIFVDFKNSSLIVEFWKKSASEKHFYHEKTSIFA